ncbi:MAG: AtpZ/AtpI family protein [Chitinophagales bacterium]
MNKWLIYSGMALEMFAIIGVFTWLGILIDKKWQLSPLFTLVFLLFGLCISFYLIFKQINKFK